MHHLQLIHQQQPNFKLTCGLHECTAKFGLVNSWRRHILRKHTECRAALNDNNDSEMSDNDLAVDVATGDSSFLAESISNSVSTDMSVADLVDTLKRHFALFILQLQEKHSVVRNVQETVVDN